MSEVSPADMKEQQRQSLDLMGIQIWEQRTAVPAREKVQGVGEKESTGEVLSDLEPSSLNLEPEDHAALDWPALQQQVQDCTSCPELAASRTQTVFGVGNQDADWLVIGEAPGADEDRQGEPFVGRAGQLLNAMLVAIGLRREQVYIANVLKCRPPNNRDPGQEEAEACAAYLEHQITLIQPKIILVVGRIAAQNLLHTDAPLGMLRGRVHRLANGVPVVVTYHPAYLLRSPQEKRKAWADLCLARTTLLSVMEHRG